MLRTDAIPNPTTPGTITTAARLNLLAYVHLRNINASTGAGRVARQLTENLSLRDDVNLRVLADAADQARILPLVQQPWTGFRYHTFSSDTSRQQARWFAVGSPSAEAFWPEAQLVFCTGESYVPVRKARLAVTMHDAAYFEDNAHASNSAFRMQRLKWRLLFHRLQRRADMFHTVSHFSAERLAHFFPSMSSRIRVVHNAVTPHFFTSVSDEGKQYLKEAGLSNRPYVLIPGGLHFRKNADLILASIPRLLQQSPDVVFAIVNHSDPGYVARAAALGPNLRFLGFVSDPALHALYSAATVVWFPSLYEGFGLPVIEAMACGAPVVASDASSIPEVAGNAAILVDPHNSDAHIQAIEFLLTNLTAREQLSTKGRARAAMFTWASSANKLKQAFDALF